eukprot:scaffold7998_cov258-Pinguiococcus_pyrenoidosus.AAC.6
MQPHVSTCPAGRSKETQGTVGSHCYITFSRSSCVAVVRYRYPLCAQATPVMGMPVRALPTRTYGEVLAGGSS